MGDFPVRYVKVHQRVTHPRSHDLPRFGLIYLAGTLNVDDLTLRLQTAPFQLVVILHSIPVLGYVYIYKYIYICIVWVQAFLVGDTPKIVVFPTMFVD